MNYFTLFNLPVCYNIDVKLLESRFQDLQRQYHPDKFAGKTYAEQLEAVSRSATINQAWQVLHNPLTRAEYLLSLHGFNLSEHYIIRDDAFLVDQLALREELEDIVKQAKNRIQLESFIKRIQNIFDNLYHKMIKQLDNSMWAIAAETVCKLRFFNKLKNSAEQFAETLLDL